MNRRGRLPLILLGALALLFGAGLGLVVSGSLDLRPSQRGQGTPTDPLATMVVSGITTSVVPAPSSDATGGSASPASPTAPPTAAASGAPGASGSSGPSGPSESGGPQPSAGASAGTGSSGSSGASGSSGPDPSPRTGSVTPARLLYHGDRSKKIVALTFDDGYSPPALRQILAILKKEKVTATFFPYGWAVHADVAGWHQVVAAGYPIGNHTLAHVILTSLTPAQVVDQMVRGRRAIDLYSGGTSINVMRPPGGAFNAQTRLAVAQAGYPVMAMWDVDTFDWKGLSTATILARATRGTNGSIVLMHAGPPNTVKALPAIIASYRARGFTFVTVPEMLSGQ